MESKKINKIITISGEPVSGKGTTVKLLINKLKELGYTDEQIHVECTGNEFRNYFSHIIKFIKNIDNSEVLKDLVDSKEMQDFFKNSTYRKVLANTIAKLKEANIDLSNFKIEQANNMEEFANIRAIVDTLIDTRMKEKGKTINQEYNPNDIWIIDSRLAFSNIPEAFSIRLTANPRIAGERLFEDKSRGVEDKGYKNVEEAIEKREERRKGERKRYLERYNVDLEDENNYDLIIDTSYSTIEDISDTILKCFKCYYNNQEFGKKWVSPKTLLPLQPERETFAPTFLGISMEELENKIKQVGYYSDSLIEVINVDGINYIIEGHHRNFAMAHMGKTLVPYTIIAKDDEMIPNMQNTARSRAESIKISYLYGHESIIKDFSYEEIYPNIYQKIIDEQEER